MPAPRKYPDELRERAISFALDLVEGPEKLSVNAVSRGIRQWGVVQGGWAAVNARRHEGHTREGADAP